MKKIKPLNLSSERRVELLGHYFQVDNEHRIVYVKLRYDKASDVLETNFGEEGCGMFKNSILQSVGDIYGNIPMEYRVEIEFCIGDYEGYEPREVLNRFNEALELNNYQAQRDKKRRWLRASLLVLAGLAILALMGLGSSQNWFGEDGSTSASLWNEVLDIAGWVFIWEAVTISFLQQNELGLLGVKILSRTNGIRFYKSGNPELLAEENGSAIVAKWEEEGRFEKSGKLALLISSSGFLAFGVASTLATLLSLKSYTPGSEDFWGLIASALIVLVVDSLAGITGICCYLGKRKLGKFTPVFGAMAFIYLVSSIVISVVYQSAGFTFSAVVTAVLQIGYVYGIITDQVKRKRMF